MRVLSTKLSMVDNFSSELFYRIIVQWLQNAGPCRPIGDAFARCSSKEKVHLQEHYCTADTFTARRGDNCFYLFKLEHVFHEQTWTTEVIFQEALASKTVFFHIDCSRDATRFDEAPDIRTDVIRAFVKSGSVKQVAIPITSEPIEVTQELEQCIISAVKGHYTEEMPMVFITPFFGTMGTAVSEDALAKKLSGIAYVVRCDNEVSSTIQAKAKVRVPFNGAVAIYCSGGKPKVYRKEDAFYGSSLDQQILGEVQRFVTAKVDSYAPSWRELRNEQIQADALEKARLLDEAFDENGTLEEQLRRARDKISELMDENRTLRFKNEALELALSPNEDSGVIHKAPIKEFFDGEQHDLIVTVLNNALRNYTTDSRAYELLEAIIAANPECGNGREILATVKSVLSGGQAPRDSDFAKLRAVGFEVVSEQNHYKLRFMGNEKYWFTLFKTPSDARSGKNLVSDITKKISIYK